MKKNVLDKLAFYNLSRFYQWGHLLVTLQQHRDNHTIKEVKNHTPSSFKDKHVERVN